MKTMHSAGLLVCIISKLVQCDEPTSPFAPLNDSVPIDIDDEKDQLFQLYDRYVKISSEPLLRPMKPDQYHEHNHPISVWTENLMQDMVTEIEIENSEWSFMMGMSVSTYLCMIATLSSIILLFITTFMWASAKKSVPLLEKEQETPKTEVQRLLNGRKSLTKRVLTFNFDKGLPCPKKSVPSPILNSRDSNDLTILDLEKWNQMAFKRMGSSIPRNVQNTRDVQPK